MKRRRRRIFKMIVLKLFFLFKKINPPDPPVTQYQERIGKITVDGPLVIRLPPIRRWNGLELPLIDSSLDEISRNQARHSDAAPLTDCPLIKHPILPPSLSLSLSLSLTAANDRVAMILAQSSHSKLPNEPEIFRSSTRFHVEPGRMLVVGSIIVDLTPRSV